MSFHFLVLLFFVYFPLQDSRGRSFYVNPEEAKEKKTSPSTESARSITELEGTLQPGDTVYLAEGTYQTPVMISDSGTATNPIVIRNEDNQKVVIKQTTWRLKDAFHVILEGLTFKDCSPAIVFDRNASYNVVRNNQFINCPPVGRGNYERAILGQGPESHHNIIEENVFKRPYEPRGNEGPEGLNVKEGNRHWVIRANRISGYMYGMQLGIGARSDPPGYIIVEDNEIFDCHEGLHIKAADCLIRGNYIHDMQRVGWMMAGTGIFLRSCPRTTVENNRIERAENAGIRVLGSFHLIRNNLIVDTLVGVWLSNHAYGAAGKSIWLVHNTVVNAVLPLWISGGEVFVFNNIFGTASGSETAIFVADKGTNNPIQKLKPSWYGPYAGKQDSNAYYIADFNLFYGVKPPPGRHPVFPPDHERIDNSWWGAHNFQGEPQFIDPVHGDYRLLSDSPARRSGRRLPNCSFDAKGRLRNLGRPDLGAYQAQP